MKKLIFSLLVAFCGFFAAPAFASSSEYTVNDQAIEQVFASALEVAPAASMMPVFNNALGDIAGTQAVVAEKNAVVAFILAWFLGYLGVHRFYLGTKTLTGVGYICTAGGCFVVSFVDTVLLLIGLIKDDISKYVDNPKFFMW